MSSSLHPHPLGKFKGNAKPKLKSPPQDLNCTSYELHPSAIPAGKDPREFYLNALHNSMRQERDINPAALVPAPLISASSFVPPAMIRLLMREKKDSALGAKYSRGDSITDMEGAMHMFVTPIIPRCEVVGDYKYESGHGIIPFGVKDNPNGEGKVQLTRSVALSALIQPDFEDTRVMLRVCKLDTTAVIGKDLLHEWEMYSAAEKGDNRKREAYDDRLRAHMVFHLTSSHHLPPYKAPRPMSTGEAIELLESVIKSNKDVEDRLVDRFMTTHKDLVISLELLYNSAIQQVINEFSALEALFPQGYVYTYDPPSIFAREIGSQILNRLFLAAVKAVSNHNKFTRMRTFAINDYADKALVSLVLNALATQGSSEGGSSVRCVAKQDLFKGKGGLYGPTHHEKGAILVVHNNSDGFGQNIETEGMNGSLDGTMGASSSAAASLERNRKDLLDSIF